MRPRSPRTSRPPTPPASSPPPPAPPPTGLLHTSLFLLCVFVYWNSLQCGFVFDDVTAIRDNRDLRPHVPLKNLFNNDFWGTPMSKEQSHKSYRPLTVLTFRWNYLIHQLDPIGYHLGNVLLHGAVTLMYYKVCQKLVSIGVSFIAAVLFAVHPVHSEAVTGVVGRAELLSSLFFCWSLLTYSQASSRFHRTTRWKYMMWALVLTAVAMLCKEQGITALAVCATYEVFVAQRLSPRDLWLSTSWVPTSVQRVCVMAAFGLGLLLFRVRMMCGQLPVFTRFDNPAAVAPAPARQLTLNYLVSVNFGLLLNPSELLCDWTMNTVPLVTSLFDARNLATVATYGLFASLLVSALTSSSRRSSSVVLTSLSLLVFPFLPASNLFFPVGFVVAERVLYLPSMGFSLLVAVGFHRVYRRASKWAWAAQWAWAFGLALLCALHATRTVVRNADWVDEYSIFTSGLKVTSGNAKLFNNVGHALESKGEHAQALTYFRHAVSVQPDDIGGYINVGRTLNHLRRFKEAEEVYLKAKSLLPRSRPGETYHARLAPNHLSVFLNLANLISQNGSRLEEADSLYRQAISMRADYTEAYINRGDILIKLNRTNEAKEVYQRALEFDSTNPDIYYNLGVVFLEQGEHSQALAYLNKALEHDPDHQQALLNSAILIQESGSTHLRQTAMDRLMRLVQTGQHNERVFFNIGMLAMDSGDTLSAEHWFRKAVEAKPDFRAALFNLALMLSESAGRAMEAAPFLHQLHKFHPNHIKGLILLGDLYVNHVGDLKAAERCYRKILQLEPDNVQGLHNLCVVMVEAGDLTQAQACLQEAKRLAPEEEYIGRHLSIVEQRIEEMGADLVSH